MGTPEGARLVRIHTADATPQDLAGARALMDLVFDGDFADDDWEHSIGGQHVFVHDDADGVVGHGSLVQRRLYVADGSGEWLPLRCGYVEAVGVHPDHRRQGIADGIMRELEALVPAYDLLALGASDMAAPLYLRRGWRAWQGELGVITPAGWEPTPDESGGVLVLGDRDLTARLACDWRAGDVW